MITLSDMAPVTPPHDLPDTSARHAVAGSNRRDRFPRSASAANRNDIILGKPSPSVTLSALLSPFTNHIRHIVFVATGKEMLWTYAAAAIAMVTDLDAIDSGYLQVVCHAVGYSMREDGAPVPATNAHLSVPVRILVRKPVPTRSEFRTALRNRPALIDLGPEPVSERRSWRLLWLTKPLRSRVLAGTLPAVATDPAFTATVCPEELGGCRSNGFAAAASALPVRQALPRHRHSLCPSGPERRSPRCGRAARFAAVLVGAANLRLTALGTGLRPWYCRVTHELTPRGSRLRSASTDAGALDIVRSITRYQPTVGVI